MKTRLLRPLLLVIPVCLAAAVIRPLTAAHSLGSTMTTRKITAAFYDQSRPLRDIAKVKAGGGGGGTAAAPASPALGAQATGLTIVQNFAGISTPPNTTSTWASDATGAPGPNHYMQATNFSAAIYDKQGTLLLGPFPTSDFWDGFSARAGARGAT